MATSFTHQVGGHPSTILSSPLSSSTLIKPACRTELDFYRSVGPTLGDGEFMQEWCPAFYGTLTLQGKANAEGHELNDDASTRDAPPELTRSCDAQMLVLENLTHKFRRPNVLDIKLGQVLYDEASASPDKIERMKRAAEKTTSGELGLRLTGFQVWDFEKEAYVQTPKPFGRTLQPSELDLGLSRFFYPSHTSLSASEQLASTSSSSSPPSPDLPVPPTSFPPTLPPDLVLPILRTLLRRLERLSILLKSLKGLKMRGASLLIVVEGDPAVLEKSLLRAVAASTADEVEGQEDDEEEDEDLDDEGNAVEESLIPFEIKVIDFAHTTTTRDSDDVDEGVIFGVENVKRGLGKLVERIEADEKRLRN
ncbi:hypothetical protein JCM11491_001182 [Sporobolomyces phaffii]